MSKKRTYKIQDEFVAVPFKDIITLNLVKTVEKLEYRARMGANHVYVKEAEFENLLRPRFEEADWEVATADFGQTEKRIIFEKLGVPKAEFILNPLKHGEIVVYSTRHEDEFGIVGLSKGKLRLFSNRNRKFANPIGFSSIIVRRATKEEIEAENLQEMQEWIEGDGFLSITIFTRDPDQEFLRRMLAARAEQETLADGRRKFSLRMTHQAYRVLHARCTGYRHGRINGRRKLAAKTYEGNYDIRQDYIN